MWLAFPLCFVPTLFLDTWREERDPPGIYLPTSSFPHVIWLLCGESFPCSLFPPFCSREGKRERAALVVISLLPEIGEKEREREREDSHSSLSRFRRGGKRATFWTCFSGETDVIRFPLRFLRKKIPRSSGLLFLDSSAMKRKGVRFLFKNSFSQIYY